ncbi:MAG: hypothetical protein OEW11_03280 [Nitrospirota bacterium]|nr:hypothetical protein [Nitrospirota bacterium]
MNQKPTRMLLLNRFPGLAVGLASTILFLALAVLPATAGAATPGEGVGGVFHDGLYGGAVGALVGTALLAFIDHPGDHLDYISTGAAAGVLAGVVWGAYSVSRPYAYWQDGGLHTGVLLPELSVTSAAATMPNSTREVTAWWRLFGVRY